MTLGEFRKLTVEMSDDLNLVIRGYEGGVNYVDNADVCQIRVGYNSHDSYSGAHVIIDSSYDHTAKQVWDDDDFVELPIETVLHLYHGTYLY